MTTIPSNATACVDPTCPASYHFHGHECRGTGAGSQTTDLSDFDLPDEDDEFSPEQADLSTSNISAPDLSRVSDATVIADTSITASILVVDNNTPTKISGGSELRDSTIDAPHQALFIEGSAIVDADISIDAPFGRTWPVSIRGGRIEGSPEDPSGGFVHIFSIENGTGDEMFNYAYPNSMGGLTVHEVRRHRNDDDTETLTERSELINSNRDISARSFSERMLIEGALPTVGERHADMQARSSANSILRAGSEPGVTEVEDDGNTVQIAMESALEARTPYGDVVLPMPKVSRRTDALVERLTTALGPSSVVRPGRLANVSVSVSRQPYTYNMSDMPDDQFHRTDRGVFLTHSHGGSGSLNVSIITHDEVAALLESGDTWRPQNS